jgi:competence protein ComEC
MFFCLSFAGGIFIASFFIPSIFLQVSFLIIGLILIGAFWEKKDIVVIGFCLFLVFLGMISFQNHLNRTKDNKLVRLDGMEVSFVGVVSREVERGFDKSQITVDVLEEGKPVGKVLISADKYSVFGYRDKIKVTGWIEVPQKLNNFDYAGYLSKDGISAIMSFPEMTIIQKGYYENVFQKVAHSTYSFKNRMGEEIRKYIPSNLSPILEGLILGNDSKMDKEMKDKLSKSGLSHIIAISGSHIVLFSAMLFEVLLFLGLWRKQAQVGAIAFTFFYVFLVGLPASAVRAGIMVSLLFLSQIIGRQSFNLRTLVLAGTLILFQNPLLLKFDLGFQLSFLAVLGLILMGPVFNRWLNKIFKDRLNFIRELTAMTLSAQVFTLPLLVSSFGYFSSVSLISNILAVPLSPLLMALGLLLPLVSMVVPFLGWIVSIPCTVLLWCLLMIINISSRVPFAVLNLQLPVIILIVFYIPFLYIGFKNKKKELEFLG